MLYLLSEFYCVFKMKVLKEENIFEVSFFNLCAKWWGVIITVTPQALVIISLARVKKEECHLKYVLRSYFLSLPQMYMLQNIYIIKNKWNFVIYEYAYHQYEKLHVFIIFIFYQIKSYSQSLLSSRLRKLYFRSLTYFITFKINL